MKSIVLGSVFITLTSAAKALSPEYFSFLPLGGSAIAETGIIFSFAVSVATLAELFWSKQ
jgi:hypothetical protein